MRALRRFTAGVALVACALGPATAPASAPGAKLLDYHAYSAWKQIRDVRLSRDGRLLAYALVPPEADGEVVVRDLRGTATFRAPRGHAPVFTADGRFVVYRISAPVAAVKAAERADAPADERPKDGLGLAGVSDVATARATTVDRVRSFVLARDGTTLAYLLEPSPSPSPSAAARASSVPSATTAPSPSAAPTRAPGAAPPVTSPSPHPTAVSPQPSAAPKGPGKDAPTTLVIRRLGDPNGGVTIANVSAYAVSADGARVAYVVQNKTDESIHLRDVLGGSDRVIAHGTAHLASPVLSNDGASLAYLSDPGAYDENAKKEAGARTPFHLMIADARSGAVADVLGGVASAVGPRTFASDARAPEFSADGTRLALWTANVPLPRPSSAPARVDLDFWYWRDGKLPTQQRREAEDLKNGAYLALYDLAAHKLTQLADPKVPVVDLAGGARYALGLSNVPYEKLVTWDDTYWDVYRIDVATGARTRIAVRLKGDPPELSPEGRYAIGYDGVRRAWFTLRLADGRTTYVTGPRTVRAAVEDDDHPAPPPPYGFGGWLPGDRGALIYDRYDVWLVSPDGGAPIDVTGGVGRATTHIYRVVRPRTDEPSSAFVPDRPSFARAPYLLSVVDDKTKASGFATLTGMTAQRPRVTMTADKAIGQPWRGRDGGPLVFAESRFDEFPDLWSSDAPPVAPRRVTDANPQQAQYGWGHAKLIDYTNGRGKKLRAILITPAGFDPHRKYPMLVYVYEKMSDDLHVYVTPAAGTVVNLARYANHGYVVLEPDITYRIGHTTASAVDCVTSAVRRVVGMGFVDPKRIGMAGHSYGGYEVNTLVTHSNIFRAVESGASDSDLPSLYGGFWQSGDVQQEYYERGQGRLGATPWDRPDLYVENSPLFFVGRVHTPYLRIQDDQDGFVPYGQGVEFFTALRRAGKEAYMFTFIGENHGLAKQPNKDYWTVHLDEFFDHFLLGTPTPDWMTHAGTFETRGERNVDALFTPAVFK